MESQPTTQGAFPTPDGTVFRTWAPWAKSLSVFLDGGAVIPMERRAGGYWQALSEARPGTRYMLQFEDGRRRADPASRLQEGSVHEFSTVVDLSFDWRDRRWTGVPLEKLSIYEVHPGTFTKEGTLDAIVDRLDELVDLGVTALELMPVAAWDGPRGWGYDGVLWYAVHAPYGGPRALQRLVDSAHVRGLAVILDVVYNHLGPSGNYLREFGPYFTSRHQTPWGEAVNYDGPDSRPVREFVIENAVSWIRDFHLDGLRLDAVHGIYDDSPVHILRELDDRVQQIARAQKRAVHVIAESDLNDPKLIRGREERGYGLAAQWSDDFHHALHTLLTGERGGYYADFGRLEDLAKSYREGFVMTGQFSKFRNKPHGKSAHGLPGRRFVVAAQNHDQIGNRALGDRLAASLPHEALRLAAAANLLSPFVPTVFMGEEWADPHPFQYFTSFPDPKLGRSVSEGRRKEFAAFAWKGEVPDPQDPATFERSRPDPALRQQEKHAAMRRYYQRLLELRRTVPALANDDLSALEARAEERSKTVRVRRRGPRDALLVLCFSRDGAPVELPAGRWRVLLDSWADSWAPGAGRALASAEVEGRVSLGPWHALLLLDVSR